MVWIRCGSLLMFVGVALGAFGAHGLKDALSPEAKQIYQTAVFYHLIHGLGLICVGLVTVVKPAMTALRVAGWMFVIGITLFSGSLYLLSITGVKKLGAITPLGGLLLLIGWLCLAIAVPPR